MPLFTMHSSYIKATHEKILELYETGVGAELARGTLWGAYNAVTKYVDHYRLESKSDLMRLKSMWYWRYPEEKSVQISRRDAELVPYAESDKLSAFFSVFIASPIHKIFLV